jgi:octopine/nopaline transport system substrate-binding protein
MRWGIVLAAVAVAAAVIAAILSLRPGGPAMQTAVPKTVRIATEGAYPPYNAIDASGQLVGFEVDLARELCRRAKLDCSLVAQNWDGIIPGLQAGKYDAVMAGMSITPERAAAVDFSDGYSLTPAYFVALKTSPLQQIDFGIERIDLGNMDETDRLALTRLHDALKGKTVGVQAATIHAGFIEAYLRDAVTVRRYDTQDQLALDLAAGRLDAALADSVAWEPFLDSDAGENAAPVGPGLEGGPFGKGIGIAVRKNSPALLDAFNRALAGMKEDGSLARLAEQWFGFDASMH